MPKTGVGETDFNKLHLNEEKFPISYKIKKMEKIFLNFLRRTKLKVIKTEAELKEFEPRLEFETRLKYGWFHLKIVFNVSTFKPALN